MSPLYYLLTGIGLNYKKKIKYVLNTVQIIKTFFFLFYINVREKTKPNYLLKNGFKKIKDKKTLEN